MADFGGITQSTGFQLNSARPLDLKTMVTTAQRLSLTRVQRWQGMIVYDTDLASWYILETNPASGDITVVGDWAVFNKTTELESLAIAYAVAL